MGNIIPWWLDRTRWKEGNRKINAAWCRMHITFAGYNQSNIVSYTRPPQGQRPYAMHLSRPVGSSRFNRPLVTFRHLQSLVVARFQHVKDHHNISQLIIQISIWRQILVQDFSNFSWTSGWNPGSRTKTASRSEVSWLVISWWKFAVFVPASFVVPQKAIPRGLPWPYIVNTRFQKFWLIYSVKS